MTIKTTIVLFVVGLVITVLISEAMSNRRNNKLIEAIKEEINKK